MKGIRGSEPRSDCGLRCRCERAGLGGVRLTCIGREVGPLLEWLYPPIKNDLAVRNSTAAITFKDKILPGSLASAHSEEPLDST